jgi:hypothetical protein
VDPPVFTRKVEETQTISIRSLPPGARHRFARRRTHPALGVLPFRLPVPMRECRGQTYLCWESVGGLPRRMRAQIGHRPRVMPGHGPAELPHGKEKLDAGLRARRRNGWSALATPQDPAGRQPLGIGDITIRVSALLWPGMTAVEADAVTTASENVGPALDHLGGLVVVLPLSLPLPRSEAS